MIMDRQDIANNWKEIIFKKRLPRHYELNNFKRDFLQAITVEIKN